MDKQALLQMSLKEIETLLNTKISTLSFKSSDLVRVRVTMIEAVQSCFDATIKTSITTSTKDQLKIQIGRLGLTFKVSIKRTNEETKYTIGRFKLENAIISFYCPIFEGENLEEFKVRVSEAYDCDGAKISLSHRKDKLKDMLLPNVLQNEIEVQNRLNIWGDIRKAIVLKAAQPKIKREMGKTLKTQEDWDNVLHEIEIANMTLIENEIKKVLEV